MGGFGEDNAKEDVGVAEPDDFCALEHEPERDDRDEAEVEGVDVDYTEHIENDEEEQPPVGLADRTGELLSASRASSEEKTQDRIYRRR